MSKRKAERPEVVPIPEHLRAALVHAVANSRMFEPLRPDDYVFMNSNDGDEASTTSSEGT